MSIGVSMWVGLRHPERCHLCCCDLSERHSLSRGALAISRTKMSLTDAAGGVLAVVVVVVVVVAL